MEKKERTTNRVSMRNVREELNGMGEMKIFGKTQIEEFIYKSSL
jgi:hypothetical protein